MSEVGLYTLTKVIAGGLSAFLTGPLGSMDIPPMDLHREVLSRPSGYSAEVIDRRGNNLGYSGHQKNSSPKVEDLPPTFIQALLSVEDARFGAHPGVDPISVFSAGVDTLRGNRRGGSTITQQLVKNSVTGNDLTVERKIKEAILSVRISESHSSSEILQAYLANVWFGRGQEGASGASLAWFGKPWSEIQLHEAAFLAGILKGPAHYDPEKNPELAVSRRNIVLDMMFARKMISEAEHTQAKMEPLTVIPAREAEALLGRISPWVSSAVNDDFSKFGILESAYVASGDMSVHTTIDPELQKIAETSLMQTIEQIGGKGAAGQVSVPQINFGDDLTGAEINQMRNAAAQHLASNRDLGRVIIHSAKGETVYAILDRGYGPLEWQEIEYRFADLKYNPKPGDVMPYTRENGVPVLQSVPQVQGAVVIMAPETGAVLASVGGYDPIQSPFDRTRAMRQPGSSIKPFLWLEALESGMVFDELVEDLERTYQTPGGALWRPRNYDGKQSGLIPLFVGLEESSNLVAAGLASRLGITAMAEMTEAAGIYEPGTMRLHPSSALGASETTLTQLTAGYAALANGGKTVTPHHISNIRKNGRVIWTPSGIQMERWIATAQNTADVTSMLYGVTQRGTAASTFRGSPVKVAGKTGTTQDYRDAWLMSFTPGYVVGVWIGRDDFTPIPGRRTGSSAAGPVARKIFDALAHEGLISSRGTRIEQSALPDWPPTLLAAGRRTLIQQGHAGRPSDPGEPFKRPLGSDAGYLDREPWREDQIDFGSSTPNLDGATSNSGDYLSGHSAGQNAGQAAGGYLDSEVRSEDGMLIRAPW